MFRFLNGYMFSGKRDGFYGAVFYHPIDGVAFHDVIEAGCVTHIPFDLVKHEGIIELKGGGVTPPPL